MAIQKINLGTEPHGVGGDSYRTANEKINSNFEEVGKDIKGVLDVIQEGDFAKSAYDIAVKNGFVGSESAWLSSLIGQKGEKGVGVVNVIHNNDDTLTFNFTDNTRYTTRSLKGEKGIQGPEGKSVYNIAVSHGFEGDEKDWLNYILENSETVSDLFADAGSLEQFVNGSEDETVLTRLSAEYPTLQKALKELFESGAIAGRFKTLVKLQESPLVDGDYALVADDTYDKNGIYIKQGGTWVKSKYSIDNYVSNAVKEQNIAISGGDVLSGEVVPDRLLMEYGDTVLKYNTNYKTIKFDVTGIDYVLVEGATDDIGWQWVVTDANVSQRLELTENYGNGIIKIPDGGERLIRTYSSSSDDIVESDLKVSKKFSETVKDLSAEVADLESRITSVDEVKLDKYFEVRDLPINPISGALVNDNPRTSILLAYGSGRKYIAYNVENVDQLVIENAVDTDKSQWVFSNSKEVASYSTRHSFPGFYGNGVLEIPEGVKWAVRNYYFDGAGGKYPPIIENENLSIKSIKQRPTTDDWQLILSQVDDIKNKPEGESITSYEYAQEVIANSGLNVYKLSDFDGADSHEKIETAVKFIKLGGVGGVLDLESGIHKRRSAILMPDNLWLYLNDSTLMLEDGVHDNLIRNDGVVVPSDPYATATELNENRNIRIFGNGKDRSFIKGPDVPKTAPHPINGGNPVPWVGDWYGWRTLEVNLLNVKDYAIHGFSVINNRCWGITQQHGCEDFKIHDIYFDNWNKNGDGIDILMGCKDGDIYNISGRTHDDMVALSALHEYVTSNPDGNYIYPMMLGSWEERGFGLDIEDIRVHNVVGSGNYHGLRLLASGGSKLKNISISKIHDAEDKGFRIATIIAGTGYGSDAKMGDMININVNDVKSTKARYTLKIDGPYKDTWFNNINQTNPENAAIGTNWKAKFDNVRFTRITGDEVEF